MTACLALMTLAATLVQTPSSITNALAGSWKGTLEYRDYRSDKRVTLPTALVITTAANGNLEYAYTYDDGPGKTVRSIERITMDMAASTYRVQNGEGYDATFKMVGQNTGLPATMVLSGSGTENDMPVELRITVSVTASALTMLRESRKNGGEWLFRNRYALTRQ